MKLIFDQFICLSVYYQYVKFERNSLTQWL